MPHKGWVCYGVLDKGENAADGDEIEYEKCEMCGNERIRFVHIMKHEDYPKMLRVGCICAEKMSGDYENPRKAENALKNKALRKKSFLKKPWRYNSRKGTLSKKYKGMYITLVKGKYGSWGIYFANTSIWQIDGNKIESLNKAEELAFELFDEYYKLKDTA